MAKILRVNGHKEDIEYEGPKDTLSLQQIQTTIDGYFEVVKVPFCHNILLVDEEGKLKNKPINVLASTLAQKEIVGDVILCTYQEMES